MRMVTRWCGSSSAAHRSAHGTVHVVHGHVDASARVRGDDRFLAAHQGRRHAGEAMKKQDDRRRITTHGCKSRRVSLSGDDGISLSPVMREDRQQYHGIRAPVSYRHRLRVHHRCGQVCQLTADGWPIPPVNRAGRRSMSSHFRRAPASGRYPQRVVAFRNDGAMARNCFI